MRPIAYPALFALILLAACGQLKKKEKASEENLGTVLKETVASGDTGFYRIASFKKENISDNLCQHWERNKYDGATSSVYVRDENEKPINAQYNFFKDGTVLENGRHRVRLGTWRMAGRDTLVLSLNGNIERKYHVTELSSKDLRLTTRSEDGKMLHLNLSGNQLVHKNMINDPFHPSNNQWRIKPLEPESDSAIKQRVIGCIKFYALFYRDHIYRNRIVINFEGLPRIFKWYNGGLGLPNEKDVDSSWINCFYNEKQAMRGYELIDRLIVDYEFDWPKTGKNIDWWHQTHSVLEQMYHRALDM